VVRWDQLCAAILWRNGRVGLSFLVYTISKNARIAYVIHSPGEDRNYGW
jgi:hypothetical protein